MPAARQCEGNLNIDINDDSPGQIREIIKDLVRHL